MKHYIPNFLIVLTFLMIFAWYFYTQRRESFIASNSTQDISYGLKTPEDLIGVSDIIRKIENIKKECVPKNEESQLVQDLGLIKKNEISKNEFLFIQKYLQDLLGLIIVKFVKLKNNRGIFQSKFFCDYSSKKMYMEIECTFSITQGNTLKFYDITFNGFVPQLTVNLNKGATTPPIFGPFNPYT